MKQGRTFNVLRNISTGLVYKIITIILPFVLRTVMIHYMGIQYAGLNTLFNSILQVLSMAELGFESALTFSFYKPIVQNDSKKICELLNLYKTVYRVLGSIILCIGVLIVPILPHLISGEYPADINIYLLYGIYLFNTCSSYFLFAYMQSLLNANQRNYIVNNVRMVIYTITYIIQIAAVVLTRNYYIYIIFTPICTVANNIFAAVCARKIYPEYSCKGKITKDERKEIYSKVRALAGHKIGGVVINSLDSVVVSAFLGLTTVAIYGNYYYILTAITGIIDIGYNAILASVGNSIIIEKEERVYSIFEKLNFIMAWVVCFCCVGLICCYQSFITLWVGKENLFSNATMIIIVIYFYSQKSRLIGLNFKDAAGMWQLDFWKPYMGLVVNLVSNILMIQIIGVNGVYMSTIITMAFIYFPWETWALFKGLFKQSPQKYILMYFYYTLVTAISCATSFFMTSRISVSGFLGVLLKGIVGLLVGNSVFILMNCKNKQFRSIAKMLTVKLNNNT